MARYDDGWPAYVPVAERRRKAAREAERLRKKGHSVAPVAIEGRAITTTVWGKAWCDNLESYRDYESRLPRGRTYVRNGSVIDLQIGPREVRALVSGSSIYKVTVGIAAVPAAQWRSICTDCAGRIDSLVELLQGRLSKGVMERLCRQGSGLFPKPSDIRFSCSCLDFASMCKHVAAVLYGVGARLDRSPELLFRMRAVDENELLAGLDSAMPAVTLPGERVLAGDDVAALFGLDMAGADGMDGGVGNSSSPPMPSRRTPATPALPKQAQGRSRPMPPKKLSPAAASTPTTTSAWAANIAAAPAERASRPAPASAAARSASLPSAERYAAMAPRPKTPAASAKRASRAAVQPSTAQDAARSRTSRRARVERVEDDGSPAMPPTTSTRDTAPDFGSGPAPEALLARLDAIAQGLAELPALRAEVRALDGRVEQLAAMIAGQRRAGVEAEAAPLLKRGAGPARARRRSRSSGPASGSGVQTSTDASDVADGAESAVGRDRDPGDVVPPGVGVPSPTRLTGKDKAMLRRLEELPKQRGRGGRGG